MPRLELYFRHGADQRTGAEQIATTTLTDLTTGATYFAAVTAGNSSGGESACSPVTSAVARSDFSVTPSGTVDFGTLTVGTFADQTFSAHQNTGGGTVSGTVTTSAPFNVVTGNSFNLVRVGATAAVTVRFTPVVAAVATANVTFTANGGSVSPTIMGSGVVAGPFKHLTVTLCRLGSSRPSASSPRPQVAKSSTSKRSNFLGRSGCVQRGG